MKNHYLELICFYRQLMDNPEANRNTLRAVEKLIKTEYEKIKD